MKKKLGLDIYESWLKKIDFVEEINNYVLLSVPTRFIRDWITSRYLDQILNNNDGYKIMKFAEEIGFSYLNVNKKSEAEFFNVNNQKDYETLLELLELN